MLLNDTLISSVA